MAQKYTHLTREMKSYQPFDYIDSYSIDSQRENPFTPEEFFCTLFEKHPRWVQFLLNLRNRLVKPFGLDTATDFRQMILFRSHEEYILGLNDRHLTFHVSLLCQTHIHEKQTLCITTGVRFHHLSGRLYFSLILPFHKFIIHSAMQHLAKG